MEKKNTMLLTVIAVATLLVAVVGATFAYFSLTVSGDATTTTVTGSTAKVATLTYKTGTTNAYLTVTAEDMAQPDADEKYFATTDGSKTDSTNGGKWLKENSADKDNYKVISLGGVSLTDGDATTAYSCTYTITLKPENEDGLIAKLKDGDMILHISAPSLTINYGEESQSTYDDDSGYDLKNLNSAASKTENFVITFDLDGTNSGKDEKTFDANLYLVNKKSNVQELQDKGIQNYLSGQNLNLKFTTKAECSLKED